MAASDAAVERATPRVPRIPMTRRWGMIRPDTVLPAVLLLVTALIVVYPVSMVFYGSFKDTAPGQPGALTLANWRTVLADAATFRVLANSILIALPRTILALALATTFAWCVARTNTPCPRLLEGLLAFMFFLPELPWVLAWMLLGAPNVGLLNQWLGAILPGLQGAINVYSYTGLIVLGAVRSATVLFLFVHPAFLAMDATLEEAARMAGASGWRTLWRINLPLLLPALLASGILSFVVAMESFEIPQLLGTPARIFVFTTRIYDLAYGGHVARFGPAMVLAVLLLLITREPDRGAVEDPEGARVHDHLRAAGTRRGRSTWGGGAGCRLPFIVGFFAVFGALPFAVLLLNSFMEISGFLSWEMLTTRHWTDALGRTAVLTSIKDTLDGVGDGRHPRHHPLRPDRLRRHAHDVGRGARSSTWWPGPRGRCRVW